MTGEGIAAILIAVGTLATTLTNIVLQLRQAKLSVQNGAKLDANTALTQATADKVEEVHAATAAIVESTGSHPIIK
jgi:uncharacterized protein with von Willebrand factor type A (vWA) domain